MRNNLIRVVDFDLFPVILVLINEVSVAWIHLICIVRSYVFENHCQAEIIAGIEHRTIASCCWAADINRFSGLDVFESL